MKIYDSDFLLKKILGTNEEDLMIVLEEKEEAYDDFSIPKKGGRRYISGLTKESAGERLRKLQKALYHNFLNKIPLAAPAKGFIKGENYQSFLLPHIGARFFMRIDIEDFFGSFTEDVIKDALREYVKDRNSLELIFDLCTTEDGIIPQGAITSPVLSNIIFTKADQRILKYCQSIEEKYKEKRKREDACWTHVNLRYTRYADDMLFSSDFLNFEDHLYFFRMIVKILKDYGCRVNRQKTIMTKNELTMNGYVIKECIHLSRSKTHDLKSLLYYFRDKESTDYRLDRACFSDRKELLKGVNQLNIQRHSDKKKFRSIQELSYYLSGCRSWVISLLQSGDDSRRRVRDMRKLVRRTELVLDELQKLEG